MKTQNTEVKIEVPFRSFNFRKNEFFVCENVSFAISKEPNGEFFGYFETVTVKPATETISETIIVGTGYLPVPGIGDNFYYEEYQNLEFCQVLKKDNFIIIKLNVPVDDFIKYLNSYQNWMKERTYNYNPDPVVLKPMTDEY